MKKNIDLHPQGDEVVNNNVQNVDPNPQTLLSAKTSFLSGGLGSAPDHSSVTKNFTPETVSISDTPYSWYIVYSVILHSDTDNSSDTVSITLIPLVSVTGGHSESTNEETGERTVYSWPGPGVSAGAQYFYLRKPTMQNGLPPVQSESCNIGLTLTGTKTVIDADNNRTQTTQSKTVTITISFNYSFYQDGFTNINGSILS